MILKSEYEELKENSQIEIERLKQQNNENIEELKAKDRKIDSLQEKLNEANQKILSSSQNSPHKKRFSIGNLGENMNNSNSDSPSHKPPINSMNLKKFISNHKPEESKSLKLVNMLLNDINTKLAKFNEITK